MLYYDHLNQPHELPADTEVYWRLSGYAFIVNEQKKMLVTIPTWTDKYALPGGGVEVTESIANGIIRECYEETGYKVQLDEQGPSYVSETNFYHTDEKRFYHSVNVFYRCSLVDEEQNTAVINTIVPDEVASVEWVDPAELNNDNLYSYQYDALKVLRQL